MSNLTQGYRLIIETLCSKNSPVRKEIESLEKYAEFASEENIDAIPDAAMKGSKISKDDLKQIPQNIENLKSKSDELCAMALKVDTNSLLNNLLNFVEKSVKEEMNSPISNKELAGRQRATLLAFKKLKDSLDTQLILNSTKKFLEISKEFKSRVEEPPKIASKKKEEPQKYVIGHKKVLKVLREIGELPRHGKTIVKYNMVFLDFIDEINMAYNEDFPDSLRKGLSATKDAREVLYGAEAYLNFMETILNPIDSFLGMLSRMDTGGSREAYDDYPGGAF